MAEEVHDEDKGGEEVSEKDLEAEPQVHFEPLVKLQEVKVQTHEEDEDILFKMLVTIKYACVYNNTFIGVPNYSDSTERTLNGKNVVPVM